MPRLQCRPIFGQIGIGTNACGHHDQIGRHFVAVLEADLADTAAFAFEQRLGLRAHQEGQSTFLE